jgi:hypothetical protein
MKKQLIAMAFALLPLLSFAQTQAKFNATQTTFGRYGSDCSSGRGACSFTVYKIDSEIITEKSSKKTAENTIILQINRNAITHDEEIRIAGKPFSTFLANEAIYFVQQEDLYLNPETLQNLNVDAKYTKIAAGNYPMTIGKDKVEVTFILK